MSETTILRLRDFGLLPNIEDGTPAVRAALASIDKSKRVKIVFEPGQFHFRPERAEEHYLFPSNNDASLKRVLFPLFDFNDIEIDGRCAELVFHGNIVPFAITRCKNVKLHTLAIDWHTAFNAECLVLSVGATDALSRTSVDLHIPEQYPYEVSENQLYFTDDTGLKQKISNSLEWDSVKRETAYNVLDNWKHGEYHYAEDRGPGNVRLTTQFGTIPTPGNILSLAHTGRESPAIFVTDSNDIVVSDVILYHCGGMGLIAQRTTNIRAERLTVTPNLDKNRYVSLTADATHFVNCAGTVELIDCYFQGQLDDATNIHGIYARISRILSPTEVEIELVHGQQAGVQITNSGDIVEFVSKDTLLRYATGSVVGTEVLNYQYTVIQLAEPISHELAVGDSVASINWTPDVTIKGCRSLKNRARGFLISVAGKVVIEKNYFHVPGAVFVIAGDANYWYEAGAVRDITIRENEFDNCGYGCWGESHIDILPEIEPEHSDNGYYHRGIVIENNSFDLFDFRILKARCIDGLTVRNNIFRLSGNYPQRGEAIPIFVYDNCNNVEIDEQPVQPIP